VLGQGPEIRSLDLAGPDGHASVGDRAETDPNPFDSDPTFGEGTIDHADEAMA